MLRIILLFVLTFVSFSVKAADFAMTSGSFLDGGILPVLYTCDGKDQSPALNWTNAPAKTQSFAVIFSDPDAASETFYHWLVYNIPAKLSSLPEGSEKFPSGILIGKNSWDKTSYNGPCPPKGTVHTYSYTLYALDNILTLTQGATASQLLAAIKDHTLNKITITAVYSRWAK